MGELRHSMEWDIAGGGRAFVVADGLRRPVAQLPRIAIAKAAKVPIFEQSTRVLSAGGQAHDGCAQVQVLGEKAVRVVFWSQRHLDEQSAAVDSMI